MTASNINYEAVPIELKNLQQWVCFKWEPSETDPKVKIKMLRNWNGGARAKTNDPQTWGTFEQVYNAYKKTKRYDGIGFIVCESDPYTFVDLDHCIDDQNNIDSKAKKIINSLDSYTEFSVSGTGIHIFVKASKPGARCKIHTSPDVEIYDHHRFVVMTGNIVPNCKATIEPAPNEIAALYHELFGEADKLDKDFKAAKPSGDMDSSTYVELSDPELIERARQSKSGTDFDKLFLHGDTSDYNNDDSSADVALCNMLAFWCGRDPVRMDRLFRMSALYRAKWDEKRGDKLYSELTIDRAVQDCKNIYSGKKKRKASTLTTHGKPLPQSNSNNDNIDSELAHYALSDLGNAERFLARHSSNLKYCSAWGKWFVWDGTRWFEDETGLITQMGAATVRCILDEAETLPVPESEDEKKSSKRNQLLKWARNSESEARIKSMTSLAKNWVGVSPDDLDSDPWILNCKNGTLDLKTGELLTHSQNNMITKLVNVNFNINAECPNWLKFLNCIFENNQNLISYIQRAVGYALTGVIREQCLFFLYGVGSNGKSTFLGVIQDVLGDYARDTPTESLMIKQNEGVSNDIARLKGARFVTAVEAEADKRMAESLVKRLTGGDMITARFMRQEFFQFRGTFKIFLAANHKPGIRGTDDGIWRRIKTIPFLVRIPDSEQDKDLPEKLKEESEGILAWLVKGCLDWQKNGLGEPEEVKQATSDYRDEMDILGPFLQDCCLLNPMATTRAADLYKAYLAYCESMRDKPVSQTRFGRLIVDRPGIRKRRIGGSGAKGYDGIGVRDGVHTEAESGKVPVQSRLDGGVDGEDSSNGNREYRLPYADDSDSESDEREVF
jgi:putative DNA primase/helicase